MINKLNVSSRNQDLQRKKFVLRILLLKNWHDGLGSISDLKNVFPQNRRVRKSNGIKAVREQQAQ